MGDYQCCWSRLLRQIRLKIQIYTHVYILMYVYINVCTYVCMYNIRLLLYNRIKKTINFI